MAPTERVLVIDDEPNLCELLEIHLSARGYEVRSALTGADGIQAMFGSHPDLVLLDLMLPDVEGEGVLQRLHRMDPTVPIVVLSGIGDTKRAQRTLTLGAFDYISKPFDPVHLDRVVAAALAWRSQGLPREGR